MISMKLRYACASLLQDSHQKILLLKLFVVGRQLRPGNYCQLQWKHIRIFRVFTETNLLLKVSEMYSSDKKRTNKEKSHVTKTENDRSYIKNAEVPLKKKHCLDRHNTTPHQRSSTAEKTNYLKHTESRSISYTKILQMEHKTIFISVISLSSVHMAHFYLSAQSQHCCSRHSIQNWPLYFLKTRVLANLRS